MRIVVAGSHGLIGSALLPHLVDSGHEVQRLVRGTAHGADEIPWDPEAGVLDPAALHGADAVVNLAGVNVGSRRLTAARKRQVISSRLRTTGLKMGMRMLVSGLASMRLSGRPAVSLPKTRKSPSWKAKAAWLDCAFLLV